STNNTSHRGTDQSVSRSDSARHTRGSAMSLDTSAVCTLTRRHSKQRVWLEPANTTACVFVCRCSLGLRNAECRSMMMQTRWKRYLARLSTRQRLIDRCEVDSWPTCHLHIHFAIKTDLLDRRFFICMIYNL